MHIRFVTSRKGGVVHKHPQLVESYRRAKDGMPAHRVIAGLGKLSPQAVENLQTALRAARRGQAVVLQEDVALTLGRVKVVANYVFLPVLAALRAWQQLEMDLLLRSALPPSHTHVEVQAILAALTFHRILHPGSKLAATRWYPVTALPELQGIAPKRFHNTRVHEALAALDKAEAPLQEMLPDHLRDRVGPYQAMFLDLSDTWFEGRGSPLAEESRTKEGLVRRRIGIALLCDRRGFPLRWKTLPGKFGEATVMGDIVEEIKGLPWVGENPVAMDRAMGNAATLLRLLDTGVRFVTALPLQEFDSWTEAIPWAPFATLDLRDTKEGREEDLRKTCTTASAAQLQEVHPTRRWILDLGIVEREDLRRDPAPGLGPVARMLREALAIQSETNDTDRTRAQIAKRHGTTPRTLRRYLLLTRLSAAVQDRIRAGEAERLTATQLQDLARGAPEEQEKTFAELLERAPSRKPGARMRVGTEGDDSPPVAARLVVTFNPEAFLNERSAARETRRTLEAFLADLNRRLRSKSSRRKPGSIEHEVTQQLDRRKLRNIFTIHVHDRDGRPQVDLECDEEAWAHGQRYHGFNVIVAHPELRLEASQLVELYFAKDAVEKDFQTIKSEVELRPVHHRTDAKVRAHVTICVFALLLLRWIEQKLAAAGLSMKATTALEALAPVHLNRLRTEPTAAYTVTERTPEQQRLVDALGLAQLLRDDEIAALITERPS